MNDGGKPPAAEDGTRLAAARLRRLLPRERLGLLDPGLVAMMDIGEGVSIDDWYAADATRMAMGRAMGDFHARFDVLVTPMMPIPAFAAGQDLSEPGQRTWMDWSPFTYPFNMTRQPAASVPCGLTKAGLPVGLHLVGRWHEDGLVLRAARASLEIYKSGLRGLATIALFNSSILDEF